MKKRGTKKQNAGFLILGFLVILLLWALLSIGQVLLHMEDLRQEMDGDFDKFEQFIEESKKDADLTTENYDSLNVSKVASLAYMLKNQIDDKVNLSTLVQYKELFGVDSITYIDRNGKTLYNVGDTTIDYTLARYNAIRSVGNAEPQSRPFNVKLSKDVTKRFYASYVFDGNIVVITVNASALEEMRETHVGWQVLTDKLTTSLDGYGFAIDAKNYKILSHPDHEKVGTSALKFGMSPKQMTDGFSGTVTFDGGRYYASCRKTNGAYVFLMTDMTTLVGTTISSTLLLFAAILILVLILVLYYIFLKLDNQDPSAKIRTIGFVGIAILVAFSFYIQTLFSLVRQSTAFDDYTNSIETTLRDRDEDLQTLTETYNDDYLGKLRLAEYIFAHKKTAWTAEELKDLAKALSVRQIYVFDKEGKVTVCTSGINNFSLSTDPNEQSYEFRKLLQGVSYLIQEPQMSEVEGIYVQYIGAPIRDAQGHVAGLFQLEAEPGMLTQYVSAYQPQVIFAKVKTPHNGETIAIEKADGRIVYAADERYIGKIYDSTGITEDKLVDQKKDFISFCGTDYFGQCTDTSEYYVLSIVSLQELYAGRFRDALLMGAIAILAITILLSALRSIEKHSTSNTPTADEPNTFNVQMADGTVRQTTEASSRWSLNNTVWSDLTPEQQISKVLSGILGLFALVITLCTMFKDSLPEGSAAAFVLKGNWVKGLNVFSLTAALLTSCVILVISGLIQRVLRAVIQNTSARGETICRLLISVVKYGSIIIGANIVLSYFGVDTGTLVASMGIMGLVVGLGANKLIGDIIAGLFIIFEGEFRVGDIVQIEDYEGIVQDIGIRTTKILDDYQNIKIINNSDISGVVNKTKLYSLAEVHVAIEYRESLERVELVLKREFPKMKERMPEIIDGPFYMGVREITDTSVWLRVNALCKEEDRQTLQLALNRELKLLFDQNNFIVPTSQVLIREAPAYHTATDEEKHSANEFSSKQREEFIKLNSHPGVK